MPRAKMDFGPLTKYMAYCTRIYTGYPSFIKSLPESKEDFHDAVEVADVPRLLRGPEDAAEDGAARGRVARLRDHQVHHPLAHLTERKNKKKWFLVGIL